MAGIARVTARPAARAFFLAAEVAEPAVSRAADVADPAVSRAADFADPAFSAAAEAVSERPPATDDAACPAAPAGPRPGLSAFDSSHAALDGRSATPAPTAWDNLRTGAVLAMSISPVSPALL